MPRTYWKRQVPHSLVKALNLTKEHGKENAQLSIERIADRLAVSDSCLYKWLGDSTMPVNRVIAFEQACGINFVTQYLAHSQGYLLVPAPTGRKAQHRDLTELQLFMTEVMALIIKSNDGQTSAESAIDGIKTLMEDLAFHQKNVAKQDQPQNELNLG